MWESRVLRRAFERLELHEGKLSRAVLRGGGGGDVTSLPDTWVGNHPGLPGRSSSLLVSSWGGHKLSSCFLRSSISPACSVSFLSSVSTITLPSPSKMRKWSTLFTAATMIRFLPSVGMPLTSFSEDINRSLSGMVQKRPFSGNTRDLSADPDRSRVGAGLRDPRLTCWGFSSARTACTPEVPASERAAHPSATPRGFSRLDWGLHCASTGGGSGRTAATSSSPCPTAAAGRSRPAAGC